MEELVFDKGFATKEISNSNTTVKVLVIAAVFSIQQPIVQKNNFIDIRETELAYNSNQNISDPYVYNLNTSGKTITKTFNFNSDGTYIEQIGVNKADTHVGTSTEHKEDGTMNSKLIEHRNNFEKFGVIGGLTLGIISLSPSLFTSVHWTASLPAAFLFFSLPLFVFSRKKLREDSNG